MELTTFIKDLLYRHDCVIVPDFGGFVANYRPAAINYNLNTFAPPSKDISFNRSLTNNDGLLIGHISEKTGMAYVDARKWLAGRVKEWKHKLEKGRKIDLPGIGELRMGRDRNLVFEPDRTGNFLIDAYGLEEFRFAPLEAYDKNRRRSTTPVTEKAGEKAPENRRLRRVLIGVPAAAAVAALLFVGWNTNLGRERLDLSSFNLFHGKAKVETTAPAPKKKSTPATTTTTTTTTEQVKAVAEKKAPVAAAPATAKETEKETSVTTTTTPAVKKEPAPAQPAPAAKVQTQHGYYVVAGSFQHRANAEALKGKLEEAGLPVVIMQGPQGFVRVAIGSYADRDKALAVLREQRQTAINGDGYWLLKK